MCIMPRSEKRTINAHIMYFTWVLVPVQKLQAVLTVMVNLLRGDPARVDE